MALKTRVVAEEAGHVESRSHRFSSAFSARRRAKEELAVECRLVEIRAHAVDERSARSAAGSSMPHPHRLRGGWGLAAKPATLSPSASSCNQRVRRSTSARAGSGVQENEGLRQTCAQDQWPASCATARKNSCGCFEQEAAAVAGLASLAPPRPMRKAVQRGHRRLDQPVARLITSSWAISHRSPQGRQLSFFIVVAEQGPESGARIVGLWCLAWL